MYLKKHKSIFQFGVLIVIDLFGEFEARGAAFVIYFSSILLFIFISKKN